MTEFHADFSVPTQRGSIELGENAGSCQGCSRSGGGMVGLVVHDVTMNCLYCEGSGKKYNDDEAAMGYSTPPCPRCGGTGKGVTAHVTLCGTCLKTSVGRYLRDAHSR